MFARHWKSGILLALMLALVCAAACAQEMAVVEVGTWEELAQAVESAQKGTVIALTEDINSGGGVSLSNTKNEEIVIDLGGHLFQTANFSQGVFTIRNGHIRDVAISGNGKGVSVSLAEDVICDARMHTAVYITDKNGKASFANAGRIEGLFGMMVAHEGKEKNIKLTNTGTILTDGQALVIASTELSGTFTMVNDGRMESRCVAAVELTRLSKKGTTITGTGELVGACGVFISGNAVGKVTIDQRITANNPPYKNQAVLKFEDGLSLAYRAFRMEGPTVTEEEYLEAFDIGTLTFATLRFFGGATEPSLLDAKMKGVAVAMNSQEDPAFNLSVSGTLSAANKLLLVPNKLPYSEKQKLTLKATVAPDSPADTFDVLLSYSTAVKNFNEAAAQKKLKASMTRLDVDEFLTGGGRLGVCVCAPLTNPEGKLLVSVTRDALMSQNLGGYLTAEGMRWDAAVSQEIYDTYGPQPMEQEDVIRSFCSAMKGKEKYGVYLDCDIIGSETLDWNVWRNVNNGRIYVEGNGHALQYGSIRAKALTLRKVTLTNVYLDSDALTMENCTYKGGKGSSINPYKTNSTAKITMKDCMLSAADIYNINQLTMENCQYDSQLWFGNVGKAVLSGVSGSDQLGTSDTNVVLDENCQVPYIVMHANNQGVSLVNHSREVGKINLWGESGSTKLSGKGHADEIILSVGGTGKGSKHKYDIQHDTEYLLLESPAEGKWQGSLSCKGNIKNVNLRGFSSEASIVFEGTVGSISVSLSKNYSTFDESKDDSIESYFNQLFKNLKLGKCKPMEGDSISVYIYSEQSRDRTYEFEYRSGKLVQANP